MLQKNYILAKALLRAVGVLALLTACAKANGEPGQEPPARNRPASYTGAIGTFRISAKVDKAKLEAEEPLILTLQITGDGNLSELGRPDVKRFPRLTKNFQVEIERDNFDANRRVREFGYLLRPKSSLVKEVPPIPFSYFKPARSGQGGSYQTTYTAAIPLEVNARSGIDDAVDEGNTKFESLPRSIHHLAGEVQVLRRDTPFALPGSWSLWMAILGPPVASLFVVRYAQAMARLVGWDLSRGPSRALRRALGELQALDGQTDPRSAVRVAEVISEYFRRSADSLPVSATPVEVFDALNQNGNSSDKIEPIVALLEQCCEQAYGKSTSQFGVSSVIRAKALLKEWEAAR